MVGPRSLSCVLVASLALGLSAPALAGDHSKGPNDHSRKSPVSTVSHPTSGKQTVQGVVQSVGSGAVVVRQLDGAAVAVPFDRKTKITVDGRSARIVDVKPGFVLVVTWKAGRPVPTLRFLRPS
jgi:hypothetical protein